MNITAHRRRPNGGRAGGLDHHQYDIHVIPTQYLEYGGSDISSHQYSVTEFRGNHLSNGTTCLTHAFFKSGE